MSLIDLISSSAGTAVAEVLTIPICTIKTNYQTNLKYRSIKEVYKDIYKSRGFYGFYNASTSAIAAQIISTSSKFTFYNFLKNKRNTEQADIKSNMLNGAVGGIIASIFSHPFDVVKVQQQLNNSFLSELKKEGPRLFYRGYSKSLSKNILLSSLLFPFYDFYNSKIHNSIIAAGMSSLTITLVLQPIDYLKVRNIANQELYHSYNLFKYYRGIHINLIRVVPHFMITMTIMETIKKEFNNN